MSRERLLSFQVATSDKYDPNWHHELIGRELEKVEAFGDRDYKILLVFVPPRHGKSQQATIDFPAWYLGRNPQKEIITASYSAELAQDFGSKTREKVNSEEYKLIFPEVSLKEDQNAKGHWQTTEGGGYTAVGVGGAITGRGADVLLIDDPIKNREEADSEVYREKVWSWFTSTAFTRLHPKGVAIVILTRWHLDDLAGRILTNFPKNRIKIISFPAIATQKEVKREVGEALWPKRYDLKALEEIKEAIGPYDWQSLYMGSPLLAENQEFKPQWIRKTTEAVASTLNCRRFLTIDTAMSKASGADSTGFCDNRVSSQNVWYLKAWKMKLSPSELVDAIFALYKRSQNDQPYEAIGIEKTTFTEGLKPYLDAEQRKRNMFLPIVELSHNQQRKEIRIRGLIPRYASGSVYHVEGECVELEEEMFTFPVGLHDDVLDATAYQLQIADNPDFTTVGGGKMSVFIPEL